MKALLSDEQIAGFDRAQRSREFRFPEDHGPHHGFRSEWWYLTGNLEGPKGRRFGYQLTFFRFALHPGKNERDSRWATNHIYMAHFAVTDIVEGRFHYFERLARNAMGLAGAQSSPFRVWLEDWSIRQLKDHSGIWRLEAQEDGMGLKLELRPMKQPVLQGDRGLSRKSAKPGNASYYYSITRIDAHGSLRLGNEEFQVTGQSWMDREWSTSALDPDQVGWDWFALQLDDGMDLMFYQLRRKDGSRDPFSAGSLIDSQERVTPLVATDVRIEVLDRWESLRGGRYPSAWHLVIPGAQLDLTLVPALEDQELALSVRYWEGAVEVSGSHAEQQVKGRGYVELTGYGSADQK
ncbi:MAG: carotenoid 1,2-hydratase [Gammaproteobacteria bacterium]|nr:carotenoid 1,2-hydratase [Gammaproteobacteria bacterium]